MAVKGPFKVEHDDVFPFGAAVSSPVTKKRDFQKSTRENFVQAIDKDTDLPIWVVSVLDLDPEIGQQDKPGARELKVNLVAKHQPVPPRLPDGAQFAPVEFVGLRVMPYVRESANGKAQQAFSLRADGMKEPGSTNGKGAARKEAAA